MIVKESISFKRGLGSKKSLEIGRINLAQSAEGIAQLITEEIPMIVSANVQSVHEDDGGLFQFVLTVNYKLVYTKLKVEKAVDHFLENTPWKLSNLSGIRFWNDDALPQGIMIFSKKIDKK